MDTLRGSLNKILSAGARRFILSKPVSKSELYIKCTLEQRTGFWQLTRYTQNRHFMRTSLRKTFFKRWRIPFRISICRSMLFRQNENIVFCCPKKEPVPIGKPLCLQKVGRQPFEKNITERSSIFWRKVNPSHHWWIWGSLPGRERWFVPCMIPSKEEFSICR